MVGAWIIFLIVLEIVFWRVKLTWFPVVQQLPFRVRLVIQWAEMLNFSEVEFPIIYFIIDFIVVF